MPYHSTTRTFSLGPRYAAAQAWLDDPGTPAAPAHAATVMLLRGSPVQVLMIKRAKTLQIAASTWAFPGGKVETQDRKQGNRMAISGQDMQEWAAQIGVPASNARAMLVAAVRELFEETGVLLAGNSVEHLISQDCGDWEEMRAAVNSGSLTISDALEDRVLRGDLLHVVERWITPEFESSRFDTCFFVAGLPSGTKTGEPSSEIEEMAWKTPAEMLLAAHDGHIKMLPPTIVMLEKLNTFDSAETALKAFQGSVRHQQVMPRLSVAKNGIVLRTTMYH